MTWHLMSADNSAPIQDDSSGQRGRGYRQRCHEVSTGAVGKPFLLKGQQHNRVLFHLTLRVQLVSAILLHASSLSWYLLTGPTRANGYAGLSCILYRSVVRLKGHSRATFCRKDTGIHSEVTQLPAKQKAGGRLGYGRALASTRPQAAGSPHRGLAGC